MMQFSIYHSNDKTQNLAIDDVNGKKVNIKMDEQTATSIALHLLNNHQNTYSDPIVFLSPKGEICTTSITRERVCCFNGGEYDLVNGDLIKTKS